MFHPKNTQTQNRKQLLIFPNLNYLKDAKEVSNTYSTYKQKSNFENVEVIRNKKNSLGQFLHRS